MKQWLRNRLRPLKAHLTQVGFALPGRPLSGKRLLNVAPVVIGALNSPG